MYEMVKARRSNVLPIEIPSIEISNLIRFLREQDDFGEVNLADRLETLVTITKS